MAEAYLVGGVRTPVGRYGGALAGVRADDLAALVVGEAVRRAGVDPDRVDEVVLGAANQAGEDNRNVARMAVLLAGLPESVPAHTVNGCAPPGSRRSRARAGGPVRRRRRRGRRRRRVDDPRALGDGQAGTPWAKPGEVHDTALGWRFVNPRHDGEHTITLARPRSGSPRSTGSRASSPTPSACAASSAPPRRWPPAGFDAELGAGADPDGRAEVLVSQDETVRATSLERLAALKPSFAKDGVITAGSSSPLSDGASAIVVASGEAVRDLGLTPRARVVGSASAGLEPHLMGLGPVPATRRCWPARLVGRPTSTPSS
jgi:hypothetical protein